MVRLPSVDPSAGADDGGSVASVQGMIEGWLASAGTRDIYALIGKIIRNVDLPKLWPPIIHVIVMYVHIYLSRILSMCMHIVFGYAHLQFN